MQQSLTNESGLRLTSDRIKKTLLLAVVVFMNVDGIVQIRYLPQVTSATFLGVG